MLLKNMNNMRYRSTKYIFQHIDKNQDYSSSTLLSPSKLFYKPKIISEYSTASDSIVYKLVIRKTGRCLVLKISPNIHSALHEHDMYRLTNKLVEYNVSPCLIKYYTLDNDVIRRQRIHKSLISHFKFSTGIVTATETYDRSLKALQEVALTNPLPVFFEMLYTLACFNKIGFCHNDLHHNNILVVNLKGKKDYYYKYILTTKKGKREFYIPTSGQHPRIFDFDRSYLSNKRVKTQFKFKRDQVKTQTDIISKYFGEFYVYQDKKRDLNRFLLPYLRTKSRIKEYEVAIQLFNLNNKGDFTKYYPRSFTQHCDDYYLKYDYFLDKYTNKPFVIPDSLMPSVEQMLDSYVFDKLSLRPRNAKIYATYNMNNVL